MANITFIPVQVMESGVQVTSHIRIMNAKDWYKRFPETFRLHFGVEDTYCMNQKL